jgi:group II intron reverse transcriptase/maturase
VNWVLDADIRDYFTSLDHSWLVKFIEHRIADKRVLRLIQKWLKAGVVEDGVWSETPEGTPQGASVSTLLANIYLHYVFDLWARQWKQRYALGQVVVVRFADDLVLGFQHRDDAERFWADLRERFAQFNLELNDDKTRLIEFGRFAAENRGAQGLRKPETFDFLGFTHMCAKDRRGRFKLKRVTSKKRMRAKLSAVKAELRERMHLPVPEQGEWLGRVVRGHLAYFAVPDNSQALRAFRREVTRHWRHTLQRRSQKGYVTRQRMRLLEDRWLPQPRILHPWPDVRFNAKTQGRSPVR